MDIFLDLEPFDVDSISDEEAAKSLLGKFQPNLLSIGKRVKQIKKLGLLYDTPSVALADQAKDLYRLGYFASTIMVCRSTVEYLAYEIFVENVKLEGDELLAEFLIESLDFRTIVNKFLYNPKKGYKIIDKTAHKLFNQLYDLGNKWVHPNKIGKPVKIEEEAFKAVEILDSLLSSLRDVTQHYNIVKGELKRCELLTDVR